MNLEKVALTVPSLSPQDTIADALALMHAKDVDILPVVEDGEFRGAVRKDDLLLALCRGAFVTTSITGHILPHPSKVHSDQDITNLYPTVLPAFAVTPEGNVAGVVSVASYAQGLWECLNELRDQFISIMDSAMSGIIAIDRRVSSYWPTVWPKSFWSSVRVSSWGVIFWMSSPIPGSWR